MVKKKKQDLGLPIENKTLQQKISALERFNSSVKGNNNISDHGRFETLFNRSFDYLFELDFEGRFINANPAALKRLGYEEEELVTKSLADVFDGDHLDHALKRLSKILTIGFEDELHEYMVKCKDGTYIHVESIAAMSYHKGKPHSILGVARDITERKMIYERLQESNEKYRHLFSMLSDAIFLIDNATGQILESNIAASALYGYTDRKSVV